MGSLLSLRTSAKRLMDLVAAAGGGGGGAGGGQRPDEWHARRLMGMTLGTQGEHGESGTARHARDWGSSN